MRFMIIIKATQDSEAGKMPAETLLADMGQYHEQLAAAGVMLDGNGLRPTTHGFRVRYGSGKPEVIDGPFAEIKELIAGYTLIQVKSREEAVEWARRFPNPHGEGIACEIEVRQLYELEDFAPSPAAARMQERALRTLSP